MRVLVIACPKCGRPLENPQGKTTYDGWCFYCLKGFGSIKVISTEDVERSTVLRMGYIEIVNMEDFPITLLE